MRTESQILAHRKYDKKRANQKRLSCRFNDIEAELLSYVSEKVGSEKLAVITALKFWKTHHAKDKFS